jgi:hypothetical protein
MIWRALLLALFALAGGAGGALAHALPGSVLALKQEGAELRLTIQFPLEDLLIAAPDLVALQEAQPDGPLPPELMEGLGGYLERQLSFSEGGAALPLKLSDARLQPAFDDHLGYFMLVVSQWEVAVPTNGVNSLLLKYDAVMHEVRNSRATVQWNAPDGTARPIAEFGFYDADGIPLDLRGAGQK